MVTMEHHAVLTSASVAESARFDVGTVVDDNAHAKYGTSCRYLGLACIQCGAHGRDVCMAVGKCSEAVAPSRVGNVPQVGVGDELVVLFEVVGNETAEARHGVVGVPLSVGLALPPQEAVVEAIGGTTSLNCNGTDRPVKKALNLLPIRLVCTQALRLCCTDIDISHKDSKLERKNAREREKVANEYET